MSMAQSNWTPRASRKKKATTKDREKQRTFRAGALWSKRFINKPASSLEGDPEYQKWCKAADSGTLRRSGKK